MKAKLLFIVSVGFFVSYFQEATAFNYGPSYFKKRLNTSAMTVGEGYSNDRQMPTGFSCLKDGKISYIGDSASKIQFGENKEFDEIEKSLNVDISASANVGVFSMDDSASYAKYIKTDQYSESVYYLEQIILPTKVMTPGYGVDGLNEIGAGAYAQDPNQFRLTCGDEYVQQEELGANLFVTLKINFSTLNDRNTYVAHIKGSYGSIGSASASIQSIVNQYKINGNLEVSAYQMGGNPTRLANIFTKDENHYYVTTCSLQDLSKCQSLIDGVLDYAKNDFENQVGFENGKVTGDAASINYFYQPYSMLGLNVGPSIVDNSIVTARKALGDVYKKVLSDSLFVDHLLNSMISPMIVKDYKNQLVQAQEALHNNLATLEDPNSGALGCYFYPLNCVDIKNRLLGSDSTSGELEPVDETLIMQFNTAYWTNDGAGWYALPLGGSNYTMYDFLTGATDWRMTIAPSSGDLYVDGFDNDKNHFYGTLVRKGDDTYIGDIDWPKRAQSYTFVTSDNPS